MPTTVAVLARIGASCADDGTAVLRSLVPNFLSVETDPSVCAEALEAQSRIVGAHHFDPIALTGPGLSFPNGVAPPAFLLAAGSFWQRAEHLDLYNNNRMRAGGECILSSQCHPVAGVSIRVQRRISFSSCEGMPPPPTLTHPTLLAHNRSPSVLTDLAA